MNILITGGSSYLGRHMVPYFANLDHCVSYTWLSSPIYLHPKTKSFQIDIRDKSALERLVSENSYDAIIHLAASNRSQSEQIMESSIIDGAENLTQICRRHKLRLLHMSSDVVFDGKEAPYNETAALKPIHAYGHAKARAEEIVLGYVNSVVIRPSLIYGLNIKDRSTEWIENSLVNGQSVTLFTDQIRMPVWVDTLSSSCAELLDHSFNGIIHIVGNQVMSRAEFGKKLLDFWGIIDRETLNFGKTPAGAKLANGLEA